MRRMSALRNIERDANGSERAPEILAFIEEIRLSRNNDRAQIPVALDRRSPPLPPTSHPRLTLERTRAPDAALHRVRNLNK